MYLLLILLPFISVVFVLSFGRFLGYKGASFLTTFGIFLSLLFAMVIYYEVCYSLGNVLIMFSSWFTTHLFVTKWFYLFDSLTAVMLIVVLTVSLLVHIYSREYMGSDPHLVRFLSYLSLFTFFMLILVTAGSFVQMFLGWEGVGLASYLLINFWFTRIQANKAAIKAMVVNRIGDLGLLIGMCVIFYSINTLDYATVFALTPYIQFDSMPFFLGYFNTLNLAVCGIFIGVTGKSAQIGLHVWLPDAMEGPTPVSALIHAATMVTAGVFVMIRCSSLIEYSAFFLSIITIVGSLTAFIASTIGVFQNDIKKVIAYSTCSQLGYMVFACGASFYSVSIFHLFNHAFFKALLFLSAGAVIHSVSDEQDLRKMGGLINFLPFSYICFIVGSLALIGFPYLSGFYSKDLLLEMLGTTYVLEASFALILGLLAAICTTYYSFKLVLLAFYVMPMGFRNRMEIVNESGPYITFSLFVLLLLSLFSGFLSKDLWVGFGSSMWQGSIYVQSFRSIVLEYEYYNLLMKNLPLINSILSVIVLLLLSVFYNSFLLKLKLNSVFLYAFFNKKWFVDLVYNNYIVKNVLNGGYFLSYKNIDGALQYFGAYGMMKFSYKLSSSIAKIHSGFLTVYMLGLIIGLACIMIWLFI